MTQRSFFLVALVLFFVAGCGGDTDALKDNLGSCNLRPTKGMCIDYTGVDWDEGKSQEDCAGQTGGSFTLSSCLLDTSYLGGCVSETTAAKGVTRRYFSTTATTTTYNVTTAQEDCVSAAVAGTWYQFASPTN